MANTKISGFTAVTTVDGTEELAASKLGANVKVPINNIVGDLDLVKVHRTLGTADYLMDKNGVQLTVTDAAPNSASFITLNAETGLSAERALASSTSVVVNSATAGQVSFERAAITGDVTIAANSNTAVIPDSAIATNMVQLNAIGNARLAKGAANSVKCNPTNASADLQDLGISTNSILARGTGNVQSTSIAGALSISGSTIKSQGGFGFLSAFSTSTAIADPGDGSVRFNSATISSVTQIALDRLSAAGADVATWINTWQAGGKIAYKSNTYGSNIIGVFDLTSKTDNSTHFTLVVANGVGSLPSANEECIIFYYPPSGSGIALTDVWNAGGVRTDANGFLIDKNNVVISGSPSVAGYTQLVALDEALYENFVVICQGHNRSAWVSNGTEFLPLNNRYTHQYSNVEWGDVVFINSGLTISSVANNGSGKTRITFTTVHGLATSRAGQKLFVSAGTGWTPGWFTILATPTTSSIDLDVAFASQGNPTITPVNSEVTVLSLTVPKLRANSRYVVEFETQCDTTASNRIFRGYLGGVQINGFTQSGTNGYNPLRWGFYNRNNTSLQRAIAGSNSTGFAVSTNAPSTGAVNTSLGTTTYELRMQCNTADVMMGLLSYRIHIED